MQLTLRDDLPFVRIGQRSVEDFEIEISGMNYGFAINSILGMDVLIKTGAIIDLGQLTIDVRETA